MKKCLPILALLMFAAAVSAQITVTSATFPVAGDTLWFAVDNSPGTIGSLTAPGPQDWDFTGLSADATYRTVYRPANGGNVGTQLPDAELFAFGPLGTETYYNVTDTKFEQQAYYGIVPYDLVANNVFNYAPPLTERWAPLNFFDINASSSGFLELFVPSEFSPVLMLQLAAQTNNAQIDSMRYRLAISEIAAVDAYGTMSIPGGTFQVLREKRTRYTETRIDAKIPPLGWLDITDNAIPAGFFGLGVDTTYSYHFFNDVAKEPIAVVTLDNNQAFATQIVYKNTTPPIINSVSDKSGTAPTVAISPNPASDEAVFELKNLLPGRYRMVIFDETGRSVFEKIAQLNDSHSERVGLSQQVAGVYFFSLFDENGRAVCQGKLVKK
ncbi:MAG: T9SS type A sorting domain-containing protein [Saprospiraceae bacterium]|nr:T9SS type A sorting domain-containing protein [Saprospiraceae bacterium]